MKAGFHCLKMIKVVHEEELCGKVRKMPNYAKPCGKCQISRKYAAMEKYANYPHPLHLVRTRASASLGNMRIQSSCTSCTATAIYSLNREVIRTTYPLHDSVFLSLKHCCSSIWILFFLMAISCWSRSLFFSRRCRVSSADAICCWKINTYQIVCVIEASLSLGFSRINVNKNSYTIKDRNHDNIC